MKKRRILAIAVLPILFSCAHVPQSEGAPLAAGSDPAPTLASDDVASAPRIKADIDALVAFKNRNSCATTDESGIARAGQWIVKQYSGLSGTRVFAQRFAMHGCDTTGKINAQDNVVAVMKGRRFPNEIIILGGHYDSRSKDANDANSFAPGANDSGSQTALLLEVARKLQGASLDRTVAFVSFAGEEQWLIGSQAFVEKFQETFPNAKAVAMLNFDIVGGDNSSRNPSDFLTYRIFAPDSSQHRELAERIIAIGKHSFPGFQPNLVLAVDRPKRGSDHISFQKHGIPAVRIMENAENVEHQHSPIDLPEFVTPIYTSRLSQLVEAVVKGIANN